MLGAGPQSGVIGVFDGHCGKEAAIYLGDNVLKYVEQNKSGAQVVDGLAALDEEFCKMCKVIGLDCGATAIVGTLSEETGRLTVTNIGDCHAIIIRLTQATPPGKAWQSLPTSGLEHLKFRELSLTHKPDDDDEGMRITEGGGWITSEVSEPVGQRCVCAPLTHTCSCAVRDLHRAALAVRLAGRGRAADSPQARGRRCAAGERTGAGEQHLPRLRRAGRQSRDRRR